MDTSFYQPDYSLVMVQGDMVACSRKGGSITSRKVNRGDQFTYFAGEVLGLVKTYH